MHVEVVTLFPEMITGAAGYGVLGRAIERRLVTLGTVNPRDYAQDKYRSVDDRPYGGGPGMVMMVQPLRDAICEAKARIGGGAWVVSFSPQGRKLTQADVAALCARPLVLVCGRYEGIDERLIEAEIDEEVSIGDYVLSGGELAALVVLDATARLLPGTLGHGASAQQDSFAEGLLDCPHYTRPVEIDGRSVPEVLLSGDHQAIARWRLKQALGRTCLRRPELLAARSLGPQEQKLLKEFIEECQAVGRVNE